MSRLRARCPDCRTLTAVAVGPGYECHACGRSFAAGLVRVPRAWGTGGESMEQAASLALPYPETDVIRERSLFEQNLALASALPELPLVLGGCCCAHIGAIEGLAARVGRLAVVWLDAHGDLGAPASAPADKLWATSLRAVLDAGTVRIEDAVLVGARSLEPAEQEYLSASGLPTGASELERALAGADATYIALDTDVLDPDEGVPVCFPEPGGLSLAETAALLRRVAVASPVAGLGITGLAPGGDAGDGIVALCRAAGL